MEPKYPDITVQLTGEDGNAFNILGKVVSAMCKAHISKEEIDSYVTQATADDYDHLLRTTMQWVTVN